MTIAIGDEHLMLHGAASRFSETRCTPAVARDAMDLPSDEQPPFWSDLATTGWLGLAVPEVLGGEGYGFGELAIVLEALGRAMAPGPVLPTTWAAAVLTTASGADEGLGAVVSDLAGGRRIGVVALGGSVAGAEGRSGPVRLTGRTGPVLCGATADVAVVPAVVDGEERWFLVDAGDAAIELVDSLDGTRPLARLALAGSPAVALAGVDRSLVEGLAAVLAAAEAAGGAAWCVETAAAYARDRHQFGRPIGQFQAVKHRCADMLARLEQIRSVAWDAAAALDGGEAAAPEARIAVVAAGAIALDAFVEVAKDCIQVLGGIGFTWEHDAHLYLRRATALRQLLGGPEPWRAEAATTALARHPTPPAPRPAGGGGGRPRRDRRDRRPHRRAAGRRAPCRAGGRRPDRPALGGTVGSGRHRGRAAGDRRGAAASPGPGAAPHGRCLGGADHRRPRHGRAAGAMGRPDAARRHHLVPAVQRARSRL